MSFALFCDGDASSLEHAELMSEVCHNVGTEPPLQPITDEHLIHRTASREDGAQLDVAADSF